MKKVNIAGAGLAGLSAAISLAEAGIASRIISLQPSERAQSSMAEGGIAAALDTMGEGDSPQEHFRDTMEGGLFLADEEAVRALTENAPDIIRYLISLGVPFNREDTHIALRSFGGQRKRRIVYSGSATGKMIMTALIDETRRYEALGLIERYPHHEAMEALFSEDNEGRRCTGLIIRDLYFGGLGTLRGPVIVACGGLTGLFPGSCSGAVNTSPDFTARLFASGLRLGNLEFIQYHPTTAALPGKRLLVSEAARGEGGRLFVNRSCQGPGEEGEKAPSPWYFMEELYPEMGNLMPRDVVSREMERIVRDTSLFGHACSGAGDDPSVGDEKNQVHLDMRDIPSDAWDKKLSELRSELKEYLDLDPAREPVPVKPGIHFFMGGIDVDRQHRTNISGLYAAGECACQYHGANRLGGNSMLGAIYGGKVAAASASSDLALHMAAHADLEEAVDTSEVSSSLADALGGILLSGLGVRRSGDRIRAALEDLKGLEKGRLLNCAEMNRINLGRAMLLCALERRESRGAHFREDYPKRDDENYRRVSTVIYDGSRVLTGFREI